MKKVKFTKDRYPDSWKNFNQRVRGKAIEIANALIKDEKMAEERAIPIATSKAKEWASNKNINVFKTK